MLVSHWRCSGACVDPFSLTVLVMLELPDRNAAFQLFDDEPLRVERRSAMRVCRDDRDAHLAQPKCSKSVLDDQPSDAKPVLGLVCDCGHLTFRHRPVCGVLDSGHRTSVIHVAHTTKEHGDCATRVSACFVDERGNIDGLIDNACAHHPPATGGMTATSSSTPSVVLADA